MAYVIGHWSILICHLRITLARAFVSNMSNLRVLMVAAECVPFAKVGGLADVLGALPQALEKLGLSVTVVIPRHRVIDPHKFGFEPVPAAADSRVWLAF